ncbi:hypothetical protein CW703_01170 [Candidatus Bathyarchaeota archaeon]|nr:MAG: hypothetical protein CW703_01170 [Candidatus Bathyarchaeota archaeon]
MVAALITYTWVTGFVGTTTTKAGNALQIQSVKFFSNHSIVIYAQNVGQGPLKIVGIYVNNKLVNGNYTQNKSDLNGDNTLNDPLGTTILPKGKTATIFLGNTGGGTAAITNWSTGQSVKIRIVCEDGTFTEGGFLIP